MSREQTGSQTRLGTCAFPAAGQDEFARLSGDSNPIHVDAITARRLLCGALVVHGLNVVLSGLELFAARQKCARAITRIQVAFTKPVLVNDEVNYEFVCEPEDVLKITGYLGTERACKVTAHFGSAIQITPKIPAAERESLSAADLPSLTSAEGNLAFGLDTEHAQRLFPELYAFIGPGQIAELLALTRLVGMRCPGLHSIFSGFVVEWTGNAPTWSLAYRVDRTDERFNSLEMQVCTGRMSGRVTAFVRPPPEKQLSMAEICTRVEARLFAASRALIVGGSRGLGEITAKVIAAGGGYPIITYASGRDDAEYVAGDICSAGGRCDVLELDITKEYSPVLDELLKGSDAPRTLYYFATPKILPRKGPSIDYRKLRAYEDYYVTAFGRLVEVMASRESLRAFYPSTILIDEAPKEFAEYWITKTTGEALCGFYNRYRPGIKIVISRLPRVRTDQTASLFQSVTAEPLDVMLPLIRQVEENSG